MSIISIILILVIGQIRLPYNIKITGIIYPSEEWLLKKSQNDAITASHINYLKGGLKQNKFISLERGDVVSININPAIEVGSKVQAGDTLVSIYSNESALLRTEIIGEIETAEENLNVYKSGENEPVIAEAQHRYDLANANSLIQKNIYLRSSSLHQNKLISDEEFETQKSLYQNSMTDVSIAESQLAAVSIGFKPEIIQLQTQIIANLHKQLQIINERIDNGFMLSPFDGIVQYTISVDTLLLIHSLDQFVAIFPIPTKNDQVFQNGQEIKLNIPRVGKTLGHLHAVGNNINNFNRKPISLITVEIDNNNLALIPGQNIIGKINLGTHSVFHLIAEFLS